MARRWRRWRPEPVAPIRVSAPDTAFDGAPAPLGLPITRELARLTLDGVSTVVAVTRPDAPGKWTAAVFAHGAGTGNHTAFDEHAAALASDGIVCLVPDKDLAAYSATRRDYRHMAAQYADLARWARRQPWADEARVGFYGESEGAWVAPWAATMTGAAFAVLVSAPVVTPRQQTAYAVGTYLSSVGAPESVLDAGARLAGATWPKGMFSYADFDVTRHLGRLRCPVLVAYGTEDISMPVVQGAERVLALAPGPVAVRYYAAADHGLRRGEDKHVSRQFLLDLGAWLRCFSVTPRVAGAAPTQPFAASSPPGGVALATEGYLGAAGLVALAAAGLGARAAPAEVRLPLTLLRAGAVTTILAQASYLRTLVTLATNYRTDPGAVAWGHRGVRLLGLATVCAGSIVAVRFRQSLSRSRKAAAASAVGLGGAAVLLSLAARLGAFGRLRLRRGRRGVGEP
ncbi:MAG: prolyl oligopeptidase family serine peptidase [Bifidobacteriaceae bacterium]|jgi:dienelactone hydrolase|nr:prolyl oligopeptidase family serine peptidase [Bifidobacteriaceae bacterium]